MIGKNVVRGVWLSIPPFYKSFAQIFFHILPDDDLDLFETLKRLDIGYEDDDPSGRVADYLDPWWETGTKSTHSLVEGVDEFFEQVSDKCDTRVLYLTSVIRYRSNPRVSRSPLETG